MGILDSLFSSVPMAQQGVLGLQSILGGDQPSPLDTAQYPFGPQGAPSNDADIPANAQPTMGHIPMAMAPQAPAATPARQPGFLESVGLSPQGLMALGAGIAGGNTLGESVSKGISGLATAQNQNQTEQLLIRRGVDPSLAKTVASNPTLLAGVLKEQLGVGNQTNDIKEYQFARTQGFTGTLADWMARKRAGAGEYGMTPIWGVDANGKPAIVQLGKGGESKLAGLPEGFQISRDPIKVEGPTGTTILDPQTRQMVGFIPKDVAGAKAASERGTAQGKAQTTLPNVIAQADQSLAIIDKALTHPGLDRGTGAMSVLPSFPGGNAYNFDRVVEQIKGKSFLEAFQNLRGGGAITEIEGQKATNAIARLDQAQSKEEFVASLNELKQIIQNGVARARQMASEGAPNAEAAATAQPAQAAPVRRYNPATGTIE